MHTTTESKSIAPAHPRQAQHLGGLQVLRAIAAVMVVITHAALTTPGATPRLYLGETGVDIFFVISGFVMAWTTHRGFQDVDDVRSRGSEARIFVARRLQRILPLYYLTLLWTARRDLVHGNFSMALLKDFFFIPHGSVENVHRIVPTVSQGWTLNYEMFFYALLSLSLMVPRRRTLILIPVLTVLVGLGLLLPFSDFTTPDRLFDWRGDPQDVTGLLLHFYSNNIVLEFGYGIFLAWLVRNSPAPAWPRWIFALCTVAGFACLAAGHDFWPRGIWQGLPSALIVWSAIHAMRGLRMPLLELLGDASYAIYLFHWTTFGLTKPLMARLGHTEGHPGRIATVVVADILLGIASGVVIHLLVEKPLMQMFKARSSGWLARRA